jgi:branched-chain amino acid transport system permease protein
MSDRVVAAGASVDTTGQPEAQSSPAESAIARERKEQRVIGRLALAFFLAAILFALIGWMRGDIFFLRLGTEALIYSGLALSVDLLLGYAGLLSLGQAMYFGLGAYISALILKDVTPSFWLALAGGALGGFLAGIIGGIIAIRARGVYFALITFGMAQVVAKIIYNTRELGASDGIIGIPIVSIPLGVTEFKADEPVSFFLLTLAIIGAVYTALSYCVRTPHGRVLSAIKVNEGRLPFLGYAPAQYKIGAFVMAGTVAGLSGSLYPVLRGFVSPELMYFEVSTNAVIAVIIGGAGTLIGPIYGAVALAFGKSVIGTFTEHHLIVIGVLFMASVILFPQGFAGYLKGRLLRRGKGRP